MPALGYHLGLELGAVPPVPPTYRPLLCVHVSTKIRSGHDPRPSQAVRSRRLYRVLTGKRLLELASRRVWRDRASEWQSAFDKRGTGSTFVRARIIDEDIYVPAAPVPDVTPSPDRNQFLRDVVAEVEAAAAESGARLA